MAGFQVITYGRFWVFTEEGQEISLNSAGGVFDLTRAKHAQGEVEAKRVDALCPESLSVSARSRTEVGDERANRHDTSESLYLFDSKSEIACPFEKLGGNRVVRLGRADGQQQNPYLRFAALHQ
ncbi:MAG: hypothetical protein GY937_14360 [bacterium]|nr:hypothetical protein [bacterium]